MFYSKVNTKNTLLKIEVINSANSEGENEKDHVLGKIKFPLKQITNQDEYDAILEIPDENDEKLIVIKVKAKLRFIWSYAKLFQDLIIKSEKAISVFQRSLDKSNHLIDSLNGIYDFYNQVRTDKKRRRNKAKHTKTYR